MAATDDPGWRLPAGHYTLRPSGQELCLDAIEVDKKPRLRLTFDGPNQRHPIVIDGPYRVTAMKMGDFHVHLQIEAIHTKTLSSCRKRWDDTTLPRTTQLDTKLEPGATLKLTLQYRCSEKKNSVQLCLHDAGADGKQVVCRVLYDFASSCTEGPAIDGALINPPAMLPKRK